VKGPCECEEGKAPPPPPAFPSLVGGKLDCIPENAERSEVGKTGNELHMLNFTWFTYNPSH